MIVDVPLFFKGFLEEIDFTDCIGTNNINYHFGNESELNKYLKLFKSGSSEALAQDIMENGSFDLALSNGDITKPYPLVWLKKVNNGKPKVDFLDGGGCNQKVLDIELLVICDTNCEWLNTERWCLNISKLREITSKIYKSFRGYNAAMIKGRVPSFGEYSNIKKTAECDVVWDAVSIEMDLIINKKCLDKKEYKFCK